MRKIRHTVIAFTAGALFHKFLVYAIAAFRDRPLAPGGEVLFIPLMVLLVVMGWEIRGMLDWTKKETHR